MRFNFVFLLCVLMFSVNVQAGSLTEQAKQALDAGRVDVAADLLQKQVLAEPRDYQAWFMLGVSEARSKRFHQAIEAFRRVIELRHDLAEPHNNLAVIYNELDDVKAAVAELEQSLEKHPGYAVAEENIADLYVKLALQYYKSVLEKGENPMLSERYARLLRVRDPSATGEAPIASNAEPAGMVNVGSSESDISSAPVIQVAQEKPVIAVTAEPEVSLPVETVSQKVAASPAGLVEHEDVQINRQSVLDALERWRSAWAAKDIEGYYTAYADDYVPGGKFASLTAWKHYKAGVIGNKKFIKIIVSDVQMDMQSAVDAQVNFRQEFSSDRYVGDDKKFLKFKKLNDIWKIVEEGTIK